MVNAVKTEKEKMLAGESDDPSTHCWWPSGDAPA